MTTIPAPLATFLDTDTDRTTDTVPTVAVGRWPLAGAAAGVVGIAATFLGQAFLDDPAVYAAGPEAVWRELGSQLLTQLGAAAGYLTAALLIPFGIGLVRTLARRAPERLGLVVALGATLTAAVATLVSGFAMKSVLASGLPGHGDATYYTHVDTAVAYTFANQLQYAGFLPIVAAAGILAVLAVRHGAMQRWIGWLSAFFAGAVAIVTVAFNLPWSAGLVAPLWLLATSFAIARLRRRDA